jgi:tyrosine decarboxylase / aspartate 1-decarboxylase
MFWPKLTTQQIKTRIFEALAGNLNYRSEKILGIPATFLDTDVFYEDAPFLKDAPFLSALIANPNHIGCHTLPGAKEPIFIGTQEIERDLIRLCAEEIFSASPGEYDGYVAAGGTEANIEAAWIYRNYFLQTRMAKHQEIALVYSQDTHYSFAKAADLLNIQSAMVRVDENSRQIDPANLKSQIELLRSKGVRYFIVNVNLSTTMFGSVDELDIIASCFDGLKVEFKLHIDGAFGGFIYPFTKPENNNFNFGNPHVSSITIDGHKMLQAPYGTGIFLIRKDMMKYVCTEEASYVKGKDYTLSGSRSGANAIAVWMILHMHGSMGWTVKMNQLLDKTTSLCSALDEMEIEYFRNPFVNIIAIKSSYVSAALAAKFCLVPDNHEDPKWYKIVIMPHVKQGVLDCFTTQLANELQNKKVLH